MILMRLWFWCSINTRTMLPVTLQVPCLYLYGVVSLFFELVEGYI